ncbi:AMP-binding protein [Streptomyces coryli]|uniref:AMP-binding protein n=1 Tax=Streptomyces coryli TaxID=1128680 RepID=UPI0019D06250
MPSDVAAAESQAPWLRFYPAGVPHRVAIPDVPLTALLDDAARDHGGRTALVFFGRRIRYRALQRAADRFAAGLRRLGVEPGDRVALVLPNCPQFAVAFFGTLRAGAVAVPVNPLYTERELRHQLADCGAVVAVAFEGVWERMAAVREFTALRHVVTTGLAEELPWWLRLLVRLPLERIQTLRARLSPGLPAGADAVPYRKVARRPPLRDAPRLDPTTTAVLQYTGGTTGTPKGACLTHRNLVANAHQVTAWYPQLQPGRETGIAVLPYFHVYGLTFGLAAAILAGARTVLLPVPDTQLLLRAARRWRPTLLPAIPPVYEELLDRPERELEALRSLKFCVSGAMRLPPDTADRFRDTAHCVLVEGYGLTEASPVALANPLNANARAGTVGVPLPGTRARIVREDDPSQTMPDGEAGELAIHGPQVFAGYWNDPEDTARALPGDGWLLTGDVGVMSPDGFVTLIDRKRDIINTAAFTVYPSEVEAVLSEHPAVAEVAVIGTPDERAGERVTAVVVLREGAALGEPELIAHCTGQLAEFKVPTEVVFRTDPLPRNQLGKVVRRFLREVP